MNHTAPTAEELAHRKYAVENMRHQRRVWCAAAADYREIATLAKCDADPVIDYLAITSDIANRA